MPAIVGPNEGISYDWDLGEFFKTEMDDTLRLIDSTMNLGVIDKDLSAPPGSPSPGDRYIVAAGASGAWAGQSNNVAVWIEIDGGAGEVWEFRTPKLGWIAFVQDELFAYYWNGSTWQILPTQANVNDAVITLASTGTLTMDLSSGVRNFQATLTGNATLAFSNIPAGVQTEVAVMVGQDGVGAHTLTLPVGTRWPGGAPPIPSVGANARDRFVFIIDPLGGIDGNTVGLAYA